MKPVRTAARVMLSAIFVSSGVRVLLKPDSRVDAARPVTDRLAPMLEKVNPRIPTDPRTLVRVKAAGDVVAGLALATGRFSRPAAAVLAAGLVPGMLAERPVRSDALLKNLGLLGGLLLAAVDTEGQPGLRYRTSHAADRAGRAVSRSQRSMRHSVDRSQRSIRRTVKTARREAKIAAMSAAAARKMPG
jgi:putative oxidoreductase